MSTRKRFGVRTKPPSEVRERKITIYADARDLAAVMRLKKHFPDTSVSTLYSIAFRDYLSTRFPEIFQAAYGPQKEGA